MLNLHNINKTKITTTLNYFLPIILVKSTSGITYSVGNAIGETGIFICTWSESRMLIQLSV